MCRRSQRRVGQTALHCHIVPRTAPTWWRTPCSSSPPAPPLPLPSPRAPHTQAAFAMPRHAIVIIISRISHYKSITMSGTGYNDNTTTRSSCRARRHACCVQRLHGATGAVAGRAGEQESGGALHVRVLRRSLIRSECIWWRSAVRSSRIGV